MIVSKQDLRRITILPVLVWALIICSALLLLSRPAAATDDPVTALSADADAVNLKIKKHYTVAADGSYKLHLYVKRRILTYKGKKEHADFKFTYNQARQSVKLLKAQTITTEKEIVRSRRKRFTTYRFPGTVRSRSTHKAVRWSSACRR